MSISFKPATCAPAASAVVAENISQLKNQLLKKSMKSRFNKTSAFGQTHIPLPDGARRTCAFLSAAIAAVLCMHLPAPAQTTVNDGGTLILSSAPASTNDGTGAGLGAQILVASSTSDSGSNQISFGSSLTRTGSDTLLSPTDPGFGVVAKAPQTVAFGEAGFQLVPVPEPTTVLGAAGLLGLLGYRERRRVRGVWNGRVVPGLSFVGSLIFAGLVAVATAFGPRGRRL